MDATGAARLRALLRQTVRGLRLLEREQMTCCGVTLAQRHALQEIGARPGLGVGDLAQALRVDPSTASRLAEALVSKGWVQRTPVAGNRRAVTLLLTAEGLRQVRQLHAHADAEYTRVWAAIPAERRSAVIAGLEALADALGEGSG